MSRKGAISRAEQFFDDGSFFELLSKRVAINTGSRAHDRKPCMIEYFEKEMIPSLENIDFKCRVIENPEEPCAPFLIASRIENETWPSILIYGHGDTVPGMDDKWKQGLSPFKLTKDGDQWYGRGTADNFDLSINLREGGHHSGNWGDFLPTQGSSFPMPLPAWWMPKGKF